MSDEAKALAERLEEWEWTLRAAYKGGDLGTDEPALLMGEAADRIEALEMRVAELEDIAGDLLTRFEPWSPHDHDAAKRARAALKEIEGD